MCWQMCVMYTYIQTCAWNTTAVQIVKLMQTALGTLKAMLVLSEW